MLNFSTLNHLAFGSKHQISRRRKDPMCFLSLDATEIRDGRDGLQISPLERPLRAPTTCKLELIDSAGGRWRPWLSSISMRRE